MCESGIILAMTNYLVRHVDPILDRMINGLPAVLVVGPRAVGKTTTARKHAASELRLDHEPTAAAIAVDPDAVLRGLAEPILVDEWQAAPNVLGAIKRAVDRDPRPRRFIVTGSGRGDLDAETWPGTGRLVRLAMNGLTPDEIAGSPKSPTFLERLVAGGIESITKPDPAPDLRGYFEIALASGFPDAAVRLDGDLRTRWLASYVDQILTRDAGGLGEDRDPQRLRRYLEALALHTSVAADHKQLYEAAAINRKTADAYDRLLGNLLMVDTLPAWETNRLKRLTRTPKRLVADAAIAAVAVGVGIDDVLTDIKLLGRFLETFVIGMLRTQTSLLARPPQMFHMRDADGRHEVDVVIELGAGRVIAIEVKSGAPATSDAKHLAWLREEIGVRFVAGLILHTGPLPYRLSDRIAAAPIACLWS